MSDRLRRALSCSRFALESEPLHNVSVSTASRGVTRLGHAMQLLEAMTKLVPKKLRDPRNRKRQILWNLLFLFWAGVGLAVLTQVTFFGELIEGTSDAPKISASESETDVDQTATSFRPLQAEDVEAAASEESNSSALLELETEGSAWPEPRVVRHAHTNPMKLDPADGRSPNSLDWFSAHQNEEGYWSASGFAYNSSRKGAVATHGSEREGFGDPATDSGVAGADLSVTSLSLLTYLAAGYDHKEGYFKPAVRAGLLWMRANHGLDGWPIARGVRDHALATIALCEAYGLSGDQVLKRLATEAANQLLKLQLSYSGWGENSWGTADIISTCYAVMAIKTAKLAGIEVEWETAGLHKFLEYIHEDDGTVAFSDSQKLPPNHHAQGFERGPVCAAAWVVCALHSGYRNLKHADLKSVVRQVAKPQVILQWERGRVDMELWWFATSAIYQVGGQNWQEWEGALADALLNNQRGYSEFDKQAGRTDPAALDEHGSWDAIDVWSRDGRVSTTALASLCLQIYYRYMRLEESGS